MKVVCKHGYFSFYPGTVDDIGRFRKYFSFDLALVGDYYTFEALKDAPRSSLKLQPYLGIPATATYEGQEPWEVMKANGFVYDIENETVVHKSSILVTADIPRSNFFYMSRSFLIQPGSRVTTGQQVLSYEGEFGIGMKTLKIRELSYE